MKKVFSFILIACCLAFVSCGKSNHRCISEMSIEERNHLFLNRILEIWECCSNTRLKLIDTLAIDVNEIVLLGDKYIFNTDTTYGFSMVVMPHRVNLKNMPNFETVKDTIFYQIKNAFEKDWTGNFINSTIRLDTTLTQSCAPFFDRLDSISFLVVSEPIWYGQNSFFMLTYLYIEERGLMEMYLIDNDLNISLISAVLVRHATERGFEINNEGDTLAYTRTFHKILERYIN